MRHVKRNIRGGCIPCLPIMAGLSSTSAITAGALAAGAGAISYTASKRQETVHNGSMKYRGVRQIGKRTVKLTVELLKDRRKTMKTRKRKKTNKNDTKRKKQTQKQMYVVKKNGKVLNKFDTKQKAYQKYRCVIKECEEKGYEKC